MTNYSKERKYQRYDVLKQQIDKGKPVTRTGITSEIFK